MQTVTVPAKTFERILSKLDQLIDDVQVIKSNLFAKEPLYGSDEWWKWSNAKAMQEVREGKGTVIRNQKELRAFFKNLRNA